MDLDDLEPKRVKAYELGQDLSKLSVGELAELIETLKAEIARVAELGGAEQAAHFIRFAGGVKAGGDPGQHLGTIWR